MKKIQKYIILCITWVRWRLRKKRRRLYNVMRCSTMSFIGLKAIGTPKVNKAYLLLSIDGTGYRTITPLQIRKIKDGYDIYTKYNRITTKRYF